MKLSQGPLCTPYTHVLCGIERYSIVVCHPIKRTNQIFCGSPDDNETYINTIQQTASCSCYRGRTLFTDFPFQKKRPTPVQNGVKVFLKLCYIFEKFRYSGKPQHTVILTDQTLKKWGLSNSAFQHCQEFIST